MLIGYLCETCNDFHQCIDYIWDCPQCGQEVCEHCFGRFAHCKKCASGKSDLQLIQAAVKFGFEFGEDEEYGVINIS